MSSYWDIAPRPKAEFKQYLVAEDLGVTFPIRKLSLSDNAAPSDSRLIKRPNGQIVGFKALEGVSFSLEQGDRLAIIGRNGSGKTTLLQVLAGILSPNAGTLKIAGRVTSLININLGITPQATGHRNITLRGLAAGYSRKEIESRRSAIAEFSELGAFLDMPVEKYSSGMKMRLIFSIATAFKPEILVLDEWLSAGDASFRMKATQKMQEFVEHAGILVLASHSKNLILDNCEKGLWLDGGRVHSFGPVREVLDEYLEFQNSAKNKAPAMRLVSGTDR